MTNTKICRSPYLYTCVAWSLSARDKPLPTNRTNMWLPLVKFIHSSLEFNIYGLDLHDELRRDVDLRGKLLKLLLKFVKFLLGN